MKKIASFLMLAAYLFVYALPIAAFAQSDTGSLSGTVSSTDGVLAGAIVVVTDNLSGKKRSVTTNDQGNFNLPQLEVGSYTVKITAQGFKTYTIKNVKIDVAKPYDLNTTLEVGTLEESVSITASDSSQVINTTSGAISNTISTRQIKELPIDGRNPLQLVTLVAGTSSNGGQSTTINGQQSSFSNITRDGINVQDNFIRTNGVEFTPDRPNVDDTSEFTIVTQNAGAELGYGASQIQLVTPRGANLFHGAAFIYNRNSKFTANDFFRNSSDLPRPFLNRNQVGGTISGPIIKNKIFFFGAVEIFRLRTSTSNPINRVILLPDARKGMFTYIDDTGVRRRPVDILQIAGLSADAIVSNRFIGQTPATGNTAVVGDQLNTTGFALSRKADQDREAYTTRFDYDINQNSAFSGTFSYKKEYSQRPDRDNDGFSALPDNYLAAHTPFLSLTYRFSPNANWSNEIRGGFQKSDPFFGTTIEDRDFFVNLPLISSPESTSRSQGRHTGIYNIQDNAVFMKNQHIMRFGGQLQSFKVKSSDATGNIATYSLGTNLNTPQITTEQFMSRFPGGISLEQRSTANALLALLGGIISSGNQTFNATSKNSGLQPRIPLISRLQYQEYSFYVSDQWKAKPNLTLNLGLRYILFTPIKNPDGLALEPVIPQGKNIRDALLDPNGATNYVGGIAGGNKFFTTDSNNFAPVLSFAYSPNFKNRFMKWLLPDNNRSVIRGGYRMSYVNDEFVRGADNALSGNAGLSLNVDAINLQDNTTLLNARLNNVPTIIGPKLVVPRTYAVNNSIAGGGGLFGTVFGIDPNLQVPRIQEYNISFEREIGFQMALELRYVGGRSDNLIRGIDLNQIEIRSNGFLDDFIRARNNLLLTGNPECTTSGCQSLTVFPNLDGGGVLANPGVQGLLVNGGAADLAFIYVIAGLTGNVRFLANPNAGPVDLLINASKYRYNSLQVELRKRFSAGLDFQANYTFQKALTNAGGQGQTNFEPYLDNHAPEIEYSRADADTAQVFNLNSSYELPFGKNKPFLNSGGIADRIFGGLRLKTIIRASTGAPITIVDTNGTLNRSGRSGRQTAQTNLNKQEIKNLTGIFSTPTGIVYINPAVLNSSTGRASEGFGTRFNGQVFFNNGPGQTSGLERGFLQGPFFFNWDASIIKDIPLKENLKLQLRVEAFNVLNRTNFFVDQFQDINSSNFMKISKTFEPRVLQLVGRIEF
jgi:hypothetical protein